MKNLFLFFISGFTYALFEILFRGYSHWSMFVLGGICGLSIGLINNVFKWSTPLVLQSIIAAMLVTALEFITGCIVNIWLGWGIWDYSSIPFNLLGQICPQFSVLWLFLGTFWIVADDYLRYWIFNEQTPKYKII